MILVADSGSTKTNWCLLRSKSKPQYFDTEGYNPYFMSCGYVLGSLAKNLPEDIDPDAVHLIYYYGAGCFEDKTDVIENALQPLFGNARIQVGLDLLGAARSLLGDRAGFAAILGTGTNTCLYDGEKITDNIDSLGYLLGDEGSGFSIGKKLLGDYIRGYMPASVREEFFEAYRLDREAIMDRVYTEKLPNRFCARFTPFVKASRADPGYTQGLVREAFTELFERLVTKYPRYNQYTFNCTGSVGHAFKDILSDTAARYDMELGVVIKKPIEGLVQYHRP